MQEKEQIIEALYRKALGEVLTETQEEYAFEDGEEILKRRRITKKELSPDLSAVKLLLEGGESDFQEMTDTELAKIKERLRKEYEALPKENEEPERSTGEKNEGN